MEGLRRKEHVFISDGRTSQYMGVSLKMIYASVGRAGLHLCIVSS